MKEVFAMWHIKENLKANLVLYSTKKKLLAGIQAEINTGAAEIEAGYNVSFFEVETLPEINDKIKYLYVERLIIN